MNKVDLDYRDLFRVFVDRLQAEGLLMVTADAEAKPNAMTIGWATMGTAWKRPLLMAMVRHSRFTYGLVEQTGDFTVNLMPRSLAAAVAFCGSKSGRDFDKFAERKLTAVPARQVKSPAIEQARLTIECRVVEKVDMDPISLDGAIDRTFYASGDYHKLYFGEIMAVYGDPGLIK